MKTRQWVMNKKCLMMNHSHSQCSLTQGLTFFLAYSIFSAVLGMLQFGYNTGVINAPEQVNGARAVFRLEGLGKVEALFAFAGH